MEAGVIGRKPCARVVAEVVNTRTGEVREKVQGCGAWSCPKCGPERLSRHMAHYRDRWGHALGRHLFLTLTLRPEDSSGLDPEQTCEFVRHLFVQRFLRRLSRLAGERLTYLAQIDRPDQEPSHFHLHALIETDLEPDVVAGQWVGCGGGLDHDARYIGATAGDLARVAGYVVKGSRWPGHGHLMQSNGLGYNSAEAKAARKEWARERYGHTWDPDEVYERVPSIRPARVTREPKQSELFVSDSTVPGEIVGPLLYGRFVVVQTFDASTNRASTWVAKVVGAGQSLRYVRIASAPSKVHAREFLRRCATRSRLRSVVAAGKPTR